jgi:hypothetical protein
MFEQKPVACILHTTVGKEEANKLLTKFDQFSTYFAVDLWDFAQLKPGFSKLQQIEIEIAKYDILMLLFTLTDFDESGKPTPDLINELVKLGIGLGSIGNQRVFLIIPQGFKKDLPSIFEGHPPYEYTVDTTEKDLGTIAIQIANEIEALDIRLKSDTFYDQAVITMLAAAVLSEPNNFHGVLSSLKESLKPPPGFRTKTAYLFFKNKGMFIQIGSADSIKSGLNFRVNDETSYVAVAYKENKGILVSLREKDMDGLWKYLFCIPILLRKVECILTVHLRSNVYLKDTALSKPTAELMVNIRLFKALEHILEGRQQHEKTWTYLEKK